VLGTKHPLRFFRAKRAISSVLSKNEAVRNRFLARFGDRYARVHQYYADHKDAVVVEDVSMWLPELIDDNLPDNG
jgi:hypothetical protein